jgi:hypothetical protein
MSTNCAKMNSIPFLLDARICQVACVVLLVGMNLRPRSPGVADAPRRQAGYVAGGGPPIACSKLHKLDRDLDHEPVVRAQVDAGQVHDSAQPLACSVRTALRRSR